MLKIIVADGRSLVREGVIAMLKEQPDIAVVGQASNGLDSVRLATEQQPDVVLMDIALPLLNGIEATRRILGRCANTRTICLTARDSATQIRAVIEVGVSGLLLESCSFKELLHAVHAVHARQTYLSPSVAHVLVSDYRYRQQLAGPQYTAFSQLTPREREILQMLSEGYSTKDIAARLHVSGKTVGTHREHIMFKLNLHSIAGLTRYAIREGVSSLDMPCQTSSPERR